MMTAFNDTYEVKSVIGKGGMSTVYLAEHKRLRMRCAVKEVRKQRGARFDFLAESNILKRLQHPMLPRIMDIFEDEQCIYIVEDFVEGITLEELLRQQKRVDEAQGIQWFRDLCGVLNYLHGQRPNPIIYRDMKPSNVMLQPDGSLKLIDFGIAREFKQESNADTTYIGTKGYAAPEQFGKAQTDARTDIYALGVTMYHLLTGKSPYEPPYNFVPARELVPTLSHGIEYILNKCIQSEPEARYQSVAELLDDLNHSYKYDKAYKKYVAVKRVRLAIVLVMLAASIGLMAGGYATMGQENGNRLQHKPTVENGVAEEETDSEIVRTERKDYFGYYCINEYNASGKLVRKTECSPEGTVNCIREYDADGNEIRTIAHNADGTKVQYENDASGNLIRETWYNSVGVEEYVEEYDSLGVLVRRVSYNPDGTEEGYHVYEYDDVANIGKTKFYSVDGTIIWIAEDNELGIREQFTRYYPNGSVEIVEEYDASGNPVLLTKYTTEGKIEETYEYDSSGKMIKDTMYNADGRVNQYSVFEYDAAGENVRSITYNADGTVFSVWERE